MLSYIMNEWQEMYGCVYAKIKCEIYNSCYILEDGPHQLSTVITMPFIYIFNQNSWALYFPYHSFSLTPLSVSLSLIFSLFLSLFLSFYLSFSLSLSLSLISLSLFPLSLSLIFSLFLSLSLSSLSPLSLLSLTLLSLSFSLSVLYNCFLF